MFQNIPQVKLGIIAVSRDCFVISLSERRRKAIVESYAKKGGELYEVMTTVENENDMLKAVDEAKNAGCNALVVFLGNFGPETPETQVAQYFDGPVMYVGAAEESGDDLKMCIRDSPGRQVHRGSVRRLRFLPFPGLRLLLHHRIGISAVYPLSLIHI